MGTTKLATIEAVNQALDAEFAARLALRKMKPAEQRQSASRIADLFEIRRGLFQELLGRLHEVVVAEAVKDVATVTARAMEGDHASVKFWRTQAEAR
jgi:hypothetical protein